MDSIFLQFCRQRFQQTISIGQWVLIVLHYSLICFHTFMRQTSSKGLLLKNISDCLPMPHTWIQFRCFCWCVCVAHFSSILHCVIVLFAFVLKSYFLVSNMSIPMYKSKYEVELSVSVVSVTNIHGCCNFFNSDPDLEG